MILAMDPGTVKSGLAVVEEDGALIMKAIIPTNRLEKEIGIVIEKYDIRTLVMGDGTNHASVKNRIEALFQEKERSVPVVLVNEKYTTEMGEALYRKDHPPKGWKRFLPQGLLPVEDPVDDYVAWIIGNIYLGHVKAEDVGHKKI